MRRSQTPPVSITHLTSVWADFNSRYFEGALSPIAITWSNRLTASAGMFVSHVGPRAKAEPGVDRTPGRREIRLSAPLLRRAMERSAYGENEVLSTLAHEMIHQWQFDVLRRRPNHGQDFYKKMREMNRGGELAVTICHSLEQEMLEFSQHAWRCQQCGRIYRRQRRTIDLRRHRCGSCRGSLQELRPVTAVPVPARPQALRPHTKRHTSAAEPLSDRRLKPQQLSFSF